MYYKIISNGYIVGLGEPTPPTNGVIITKEEYESLTIILVNKPENTYELVYQLAESGVYQARERTEEEKVEWFVEKVKSGETTLEDVPQEYYQEVYDIINAPEPEPDPDQEFVDRLIEKVVNT